MTDDRRDDVTLNSDLTDLSDEDLESLRRAVKQPFAKGDPVSPHWNKPLSHLPPPPDPFPVMSLDVDGATVQLDDGAQIISLKRYLGQGDDPSNVDAGSADATAGSSQASADPPTPPFARGGIVGERPPVRRPGLHDQGGGIALGPVDRVHIEWSKTGTELTYHTNKPDVVTLTLDGVKVAEIRIDDDGQAHLVT